MIQIRDGLQLLDGNVQRIAAALRSQAMAHRQTAMMGRTFLQHARPTTFGLRAALWLEPLVRHLTELRSTRSSLVLQLGGPVGNLAPFGEHAGAITERLADRLGLVVPAAPWHTDRSRLAEIVALVARIAGSVAKIGADLTLLAQSDVGEIRARPGVSSSMPGKRNPIDAVRAVAAHRACAAVAQIVTAVPPHELERGIGSWHAEWFAVPLVFQTAAAAVEAITSATESLEVDTGRMAANLAAAPDPTMLVAAGALVDQVLAVAEPVIGDTA
jgi:3-carboxy-cis,cis-muconate cycloisomerase